MIASRHSFRLLSSIFLLLFCGAQSAQEAEAQRRGRVSSQTCPYSCRTQGIPKNVCKDWREGNTCFIEDLRHPPSGPRPHHPQPSHPHHPHHPHPDYHDDHGACENINYVPRPRVEVYSVKRSGNYFKDKFRVRGAVEGKCIVEAAYFEDGRPETVIPTVKTPEFRRFEFEVVVRGNREPEIRAYNTQGERDIFEVGEDSEHEYDDDDYYDYRNRR
jgi:hypothetical protein